MSKPKANVDPQEIAKFSESSEDWLNPHGDMKALHDLNPLRFDFIRKHVDLNGASALDIGCGGGILTESLCKAGAKATGIDLAKPSIDVAIQHAQDHNLNIDYQLISTEELAAKKSGSFDVITCLEMLEHVPDPQSVIQACSQLVKPGGHLFFSTLNRNLKAYILAIVGAEYVLGMLPKGTHDYSKFIKPSELERMCRQEGIHFRKSTGISYNPLSAEFKLTSDLSVNYLVYCQKNE